MISNFTKISFILLIFAILEIWTHGFYNQKLGCLNPSTNTLFAQKFDPSDIITIKASKPLGLSLEEFEENSNSGVYISEIKDGSAKSSGVLKKGLYLLSVNGKDVRYLDFDSVINSIVDAPADIPVELSFIEPNKVLKGPAIIKVRLSEDTAASSKMTVTALKGQTLRTVLLDNGLAKSLYEGKSVFTNCGGAGTCGTCAVEVTDNEYWFERPQFEALRLKKFSAKARLACNTIVEGDCTVQLRPKKTI
eukprot:gene29316-38393_t